MVLSLSCSFSKSNERNLLGWGIKSQTYSYYVWLHVVFYILSIPCFKGSRWQETKLVSQLPDGLLSVFTDMKDNWTRKPTVQLFRVYVRCLVGVTARFEWQCDCVRWFWCRSHGVGRDGGPTPGFWPQTLAWRAQLVDGRLLAVAKSVGCVVRPLGSEFWCMWAVWTGRPLSFFGTQFSHLQNGNFILILPLFDILWRFKVQWIE